MQTPYSIIGEARQHLRWHSSATSDTPPACPASSAIHFAISDGASFMLRPARQQFCHVARAVHNSQRARVRALLMGPIRDSLSGAGRIGHKIRDLVVV